ncbi:hypothetical protein COX09_04400, partial [Candidatus Beckwithbacteria bacterium CG23_combo_of_CG06-09_8_20_14_all_47_9]
NFEIFLTIISGTTIYVLGQLIQGLIIKPYLEYKDVIGKIDNKLKFHAHLIRSKMVSDSRVIEVYLDLRQLSCDLESSFKKLLITSDDQKMKVSKAAQSLIFLSNVTGSKSHSFLVKQYDEIDENEQIVRENLNIPKLW